MRHFYLFLLFVSAGILPAQTSLFLSQTPNIPAGINEVCISGNAWGLHGSGTIRSYDVENTSQEYIGMMGLDLGSFCMMIYKKDYLKEYGVYPIARAGFYSSSGINGLYKAKGTFVMVGAHLRIWERLNGTILFYPPLGRWHYQGMGPWMQVGATWRLL